MLYFKVVNNGYITAIGTGNGGTEITETEYTEIASVISNRPTDTSEFWHGLREDLTWEEYPAPVAPPEPDESSAEEIVNILTGGAV